jgi:hypothetical protein
MNVEIYVLKGRRLINIIFHMQKNHAKLINLPKNAWNWGLSTTRYRFTLISHDCENFNFKTYFELDLIYFTKWWV